VLQKPLVEPLVALAVVMLDVLPREEAQVALTEWDRTSETFLRQSSRVRKCVTAALVWQPVSPLNWWASLAAVIVTFGAMRRSFQFRRTYGLKRLDEKLRCTMTLRALALAAVIAGLPAGVSGQTVVDGNFQAWTLLTVTGPPDQSACASIARSAGGGNPAAHLTIAITLSAGGCGEGRGLAIYEGFSTDAPLTDANYTFTFDARRLAAELFVEQGALLGRYTAGR
jgi:hypothetical protein